MVKKYIELFVFAVVVFAAGTATGYTFKCCKSSMAVVDVAGVVAKSAQVQALKSEMDAKNSELAQWLKKANDEVNGENDKEKQGELLQKYNAEFTQKRNELLKEYRDKLQAIDNDINSTIANTAKDKGYKSVVAKGVVIYGGDDITGDVIEVVK